MHLMQLAGVLRVCVDVLGDVTVLQVLSSQQGGRLEAGANVQLSSISHLPVGVNPWCSTVAQLVNTSPRGTLRLKRGSGGPRFDRGDPAGLAAERGSSDEGHRELGAAENQLIDRLSRRFPETIGRSLPRMAGPATETGFASDAVAIGRRLKRRPWSRRQRHR